MKTKESGLSVYKLIWVFIVGSVFGAWYEQLLVLILFQEFSRRSSVIFGPFNTLYGVAYLLAVVLLVKVKKWNYLILLGSILGGIIEYSASLIQELITSTKSWDYSHLFLNIDGRTTIPFALYWGLLVYLMVAKGYPIIAGVVDSFEIKKLKIISNLILVILAVNVFISASVLIRRNLRILGYEPFTPLGQIYDRYFPDEVIMELYPNMELLNSTK
jgi:uncharacterized membrane protein